MNLLKNQSLYKEVIIQIILLYGLIVILNFIQNDPLAKGFIEEFKKDNFFELIKGIVLTFLASILFTIIPAIINTYYFYKYHISKKNKNILLMIIINLIYILIFEYCMIRLLTIPVLLNMFIYCFISLLSKKYTFRRNK